MASPIQPAQQITRFGQLRFVIPLTPVELLANMFGHRSPRWHRLLLTEVVEFFEKLDTEELTPDAQCFHHRANLTSGQSHV
jgi:hypothetical protein